MNKPFDLRRAIKAGVIGSSAYLGMQFLDLAIFKYDGDDLKMLGMVTTRRSPWWQIFGVATHFVNGTMLALFYARFIRNLLPGPGYAKGVILAEGENLLLWPVVIMIDRYHPARKNGLIQPLASKIYFLQAVLRHLAYGAALGHFYE